MWRKNIVSFDTLGNHQIMKKFLLIFLLLIFTNAYANQDLVSKIIMCNKTLDNKSIALLWGIKFLPKDSIEFYVYSTHSEDLGEEIQDISGFYTSTYNKIYVNINLIGTSETKTYAIDRNSLTLREVGGYEIFEEGRCEVAEALNDDFKSFFIYRFEVLKLIHGSKRKI